MARLTEKEKRDFVVHVITTINNEAATLTAAGFDPTNRATGLKTKSDTAASAEVAQQKAQAEAMKATKASNAALAEAYNDASNVVSLLEGLLGKNNELVHKLHQFRNI
ncbi:hypothetical protein [Mangrovibacterium lignilyticum]|uniref:hypothetical protein n=1 Tax=Mangrovibacterium lignilyticum TaxID=2668052 RepID=UPI0013D4FBE3|nr:hypothetical protein [Mangrovibacterium lignilyticum]